MKKTINVSLGGTSFTVEEDAYQRLENYLNQVKSHFGTYPDAGEIVSDIEARMAEQFLAKPGLGKIITLPNVEELISVMGTPEQIGGQAKEQTPPKDDTTKILGKRLLRNPDDSIIAGVCSGIAAYFGVDSVWVRLIFALSVLFGGFGIVLYIVLWIIMPEAKTETEKMQMRGEPVNLKNIEQTIKDRMKEVKSRFDDQKKTEFTPSAAPEAGQPASNNFVEEKQQKTEVKNDSLAQTRTGPTAAQNIGKFAKGFVAVIFKIVGIAIVVGAAVAIAGLVITAVSLLFNINSPYVDFPFRALASGWEFYLSLVSGFFVAFVPIIFLLLLGASLVSGKSSVSKMGSVSLLALWILAGAIFASMAIRLAPEIESAVNNSRGPEQNKIIEVKDFTGVSVSSDIEVRVNKGNEYRVLAFGRERDLEEMYARVENNRLIVGRDSYFKVCLFCRRQPVRLEISAPELFNLDGHGASKLYAENFEASDFRIKLSGASRAELNLDVGIFEGFLTGASKLRLEGEVSELSLEASGASELVAEDAEVEDAAVDLSGASKAYFSALENLDVKASGASKVYYYSAGNIEQEMSGASKLVPRQ